MSSCIRCVAAIVGCKGSPQYEGGNKTNMDLTRTPPPIHRRHLLSSGKHVQTGAGEEKSVTLSLPTDSADI